MSNISSSQAVLRGLDTMLHKSTAIEETQDAASSFSSIFQNLVNTTNETDAVSHDAVASVMTGDFDPDMVMLASTKAEIALSLTVQVRDKVIEAYNDIMRMQV